MVMTYTGGCFDPKHLFQRPQMHVEQLLDLHRRNAQSKALGMYLAHENRILTSSCSISDHRNWSMSDIIAHPLLLAKSVHIYNGRCRNKATDRRGVLKRFKNKYW